MKASEGIDYLDDIPESFVGCCISNFHLLPAVAEA